MSTVHHLSFSDILFTLFLISLPYIIASRFLPSPRQLRDPQRKKSVAIVVVGDIGRSPRMMYHAQSFADSGFDTVIVGYGGSSPLPSLLSTPRVQIVHLVKPLQAPNFPRWLRPLQLGSKAAFAVLKVVLQTLELGWILVFGGRVRNWEITEYVVVQNPPSIPTLFVVQLAALIRGTKVIIDWHNLGYSILAMKLRESHPIVRLAKWIEKTFGRKAYAHLFVTEAMKKYLSKEWNLQGQKLVLHDRAPEHFHPTSPTEAHNLFAQFPTLKPPVTSFLPPNDPPRSTFCTKLVPQKQTLGVFYGTEDIGVASWREDRPALVVSSTSWTADEDFGILLEALRIYEKRAKEMEKGGQRLRKMLVLVTGKGPLKEHYIRQLAQLEEQERWEWVRCRTVWLEAQQYPLLLGSADLGVSLHASSSAMDLPMKVVDMFGCGLPVCALSFACLDELVENGENGMVFQNAGELAVQFETLLSKERWTLERLRSNVLRQRKGWTWERNWRGVVLPVVDKDVGQRNSLGIQ
ncbi:mannosyltransferase [Tulasnella sp. 419]|nr:mannosyltransferase [Tulasnella sp. 419]